MRGTREAKRVCLQARELPPYSIPTARPLALPPVGPPLRWLHSRTPIEGQQLIAKQQQARWPRRAAAAEPLLWDDLAYLDNIQIGLCRCPTLGRMAEPLPLISFRHSVSRMPR